MADRNNFVNIVEEGLHTATLHGPEGGALHHTRHVYSTSAVSATQQKRSDKHKHAHGEGEFHTHLPCLMM